MSEIEKYNAGVRARNAAELAIRAEQCHTKVILVIDDGVAYEPCVIGASLVYRASGLMFSLDDARNFVSGRRQPFDDFVEEGLEYIEAER